MQQLLVSKDVLPEQQEWNWRLDHKGLEPPSIKEEQDELWSEGEEKPQSSQLYQSQREESPGVELFSFNSTEHRTLKTEMNEGEWRESQSDTDDVQQVLVMKEEIFPEQQEGNLGVDQEKVKVEQEKHWIRQQGQQLHQLEETDNGKFCFTALPVKTENDHENLESSQVHQRQSDENIETEPVASSSNAHRKLPVQADGEDCGEPQPASNLGPFSYLQLNTNGRNSDSSETETDDSCEWKHTKELHSSFTCQKSTNVSVINSSCNVTKKQFDLSPYDEAYGKIKYSLQHVEMQESGKPFGCSECGKRFGQKSYLNTHMRIHTGQKPFGCSDCGKKFGQKSSLNTHMKTHTGEKPFGCSECGKRFGRKSSLNIHMRIHTGKKPFCCSECGKRFGQKSYLNTHMRTHMGQKPFNCSECGKRFRQKSSLNTHLRIHTGQKPFGCSECGKRFGLKCNLTAHIRIHTGEKPFACSECEKGFGRKGELISHMKNHTGEKLICS